MTSLASLLSQALAAAQEAGELPAFDVDDFGLERPATSAHGDWSSTVALRAAKVAHKAPRAIAEALVAHLPQDPTVDHVEIAGPGFINFYLSVAARNEVINTIRQQKKAFGTSELGRGTRVQVEFVSANPVGPLHIGHGRWAALGDSLCRVLEHAGYEVEREYYVNDHGSQMDVFGSSIAVRFQQLERLISAGKTLDEARATLLADREAYIADEADEAPETHALTSEFNEVLGGNAYAGDYIVDLARDFYAEELAGGPHYTELSHKEQVVAFREAGYKKMLAQIETSLANVNCHFDVWFSERSVYEKDASGTSAVDRALKALDEKGYLYKDEGGALWFRTTDFGDDKDRVLVKTNGEYTYFTSDVAYHYNKFQRVDQVIDIWGADHHGYIQRVQAACAALGNPTGFTVLLGQLVNLLRGGVPVRMSKRKGTMVSLDELVADVGADATRYVLISRSSNQMIDFDIDKVKAQDSTNPVYYVQYAHARICSLIDRAARAGFELPKTPDLSLLSHPSELALSRKLEEFPRLVASCAADLAPFRLTHYLEELASTYHTFYHDCQILPSEKTAIAPELTAARLAASDATREVIALVLSLIGVSAPEHM